MEIIGFILAALLISVLLFSAFWFGLFLILAITLVIFAEAIFMKLTGRWQRFRFVRDAKPAPPPAAGKVIEGDYKDITHE